MSSDRLISALGADHEGLRHLRRLSPRAAQRCEWPEWVPDRVREALAEQGILRLWPHQAEAATHAFAGRDVVVATGTASGKSLAYLLPVLTEAAAEGDGRTLYLAPTKALAADQARAVAEFDAPGLLPAIVDGDTPYEHRRWAQRFANLVLSNPDLLHHSVLPRHRRWRSLLKNLKYVVVDECHIYRGVFGAHVALTLRRLLRLAAHYGAEPTVIAASATAADPAASLSTLTGRPAEAVTADASPSPGASVALWEPETIEIEGEPQKASTLSETARMLAALTRLGLRTLAFVPSRRGAEIIAADAKARLGADPAADRIAAYRAGYLREHRRDLEADLREGRLLGVATTNALELGIDVTGLDAVLLCGYPGRLASFWQQIGRAGRGRDEALAIMLAKDDPLDTFLVHHPEAVFDRPVEASVCDPSNPYVLAGHLCLAAEELPLREADFRSIPGSREVADDLCERRLLRRRPGGRYYWVGSERPEVSLRGSGPMAVDIAETSTGRLVGTVDAAAAHRLVHRGAVYLHQGETYLVDDLDLDDGLALVHAAKPPWTTSPQEITHLEILGTRESLDLGEVALCLGEVEVTSAVISYQKRRIPSGEVIDTQMLDLPPQTLRTVAVWWTVEPEALGGVKDLPGALHAAEHASIGLLPLVATCDRWDIGGLSTAAHPDTELPTVFVYDGHPGGAGFAEQAFRKWTDWLGATRDAIASCDCRTGCPSCIQSPKCGNGNEPLDKADAVATLGVVLAAEDENAAVTVHDPRPEPAKSEEDDLWPGDF
ncbi:DEAD/DEAH box helicase [Glycomyces xiaoerkulensis]|uniref:DEAD/DEAH box helicase n=1 Tax=Glycomyces xiaoerkulensis TaxID=2038139 RepID=UPI001E3020CA|nr:DEAD/DEAH box helicase [Glycomyces xiaoerkulensis]